jgi:H+-transporting ATPase
LPLLFIASLGFHEDYKCKKSLDELSASLESEIAIRREGKTEALPTKECLPGDIVLLVGGTILPADIKWVRGDKMSIDTAALTGEPIPRKYPGEHGDVMLSGCTVQSGECYGMVVNTGINTEIGQAQADVMSDKSTNTISVFEHKILTIVKIFVAASFSLVIGVLLVKGFVYGGFHPVPGSDGAVLQPGGYMPVSVQNTILAALAILIASIPIALPLVLQVNLALGAAFLAREHSAIVTSIPALQDIASMSMLCSDKTGTLTTAKMTVINDRCVPVGDFTSDDVIRFAMLCSNADKKDDPIDKAVLDAYSRSEASKSDGGYKQTEIIGFNPTVKRVVAFVDFKGKVITVAKGLPAKIIDTAAGSVDDHECQWKVVGADDPKFVEHIISEDFELSSAGYKTIAIAMCEGDGRKSDHGEWKFVGLMPMLDPPREDTPATIASLHHANISVKMITGDHVNVGKETCRLIGLGTDLHAGEEIRNAANPEARNQMIWNADGFGAVLPSDKREVVLTLRNVFGLVTGMTGDGVNDAAALSAAQVGIAVEGATDAARNAADLILTEPGLRPIYGAVLESRRIFARIKSYVVYRMAASAILVLVLSIVCFAGQGCTVNSILVIILALLNDISMLPVAYDNADATAKPQLPNTSKLILVSLYYGLIHTVLALIFFFLIGNDPSNNALTSNIDFEACGSGSGDPKTSGFIWLHLVIVTELAIFSVRAPSFFFLSMPNAMLIISVFVTCIGASIYAVFGAGITGMAVLWIWVFNIVSFVCVDAGKIYFRRIIGDAPGEIIVSDELIEVEKKNEVEIHQEKKERYNVHRESIMDPADFDRPVVEVGGLFNVRNYDSGIKHAQPGARMAPMSGSTATRRYKTVSAPELNW